MERPVVRIAFEQLAHQWCGFRVVFGMDEGSSFRQRRKTGASAHGFHTVKDMKHIRCYSGSPKFALDRWIQSQRGPVALHCCTDFLA